MDIMRVAESREDLPSKLLEAIAYVESGMGKRGFGGGLVSCPWSINVAGKGYTFKSKQEAITAVHNFKRRGYESIDVGLMQVNLKHHPFAFKSLDQAFDPATNIAYAARFLRALYGKYRSWPAAIKHYHSANPMLGAAYLQRVMNAWGKVRSMSFGIQDNGLLRQTDLDWNSIPHASQNIETQLQTKNQKVIPISMSFFPLKLIQGGAEVVGDDVSPGKAGKSTSGSSAKNNRVSSKSPGAIANNGRVFPLVMVGHKGNKGHKRHAQPKTTQKIYALPLAYSTADVMPLH